LRKFGEIGHAALARANKTFNLLRSKFTVHIEQGREPRKDTLALVSVAYCTVLGIRVRASCVISGRMFGFGCLTPTGMSNCRNESENYGEGYSTKSFHDRDN
jgi:hypothetical protein